MQRNERVLKIWKMVATGQPVTQAQFLKRLEISPATFKRDLEALRDQMNVPIIWNKSLRAYLLDSDQTDWLVVEGGPGTWFDRDELLSLVAIQQILDQIEPRLLQDVLHPLRARTAALLAATGVTGEQLDTALTRIRVLPMQRRRVDDVLFERVVSALITRKQIAVESTERQTGERIKRVLSPQRIVSYRDNWYVDAWCHLRAALRTFALDALSDAHVSDRTAKEMDVATLDQHFAGSYGIFAGVATAHAVLRFTPQVAGWIAHEQWHPQQVSNRLANGEIELTVPYANATELVRDILKWGPDVEVIAPASLRKQVEDAARATVSRYLLRRLAPARSTH